MDADKLNEAALDNIPAHAPDALYDEGFVGGFMACANWLMQQPLADRLTDEEKERIKGYMMSIFAFQLCGTNPSCEAVKDMIIDIFGKELFNEK